MKNPIKQIKQEIVPSKLPRHIAVSKNGINDAGDFSRLMTAVMLDVLDDVTNPAKANAVCNAARQQLKIIEMTHKYGTVDKPGDKPKLHLR
jgi:hypothetical protein|tara:strand:- start:240 stop:512 length:273 start_codon:yes stop_codon:yes gene_type:complete